MKIELYNGSGGEWDAHVNRSPTASIYHQFGWKSVIEGTYGHKPYYLTAKENGEIKGILPIFLISSRMSGRVMVSLPFHCIGGVCADDESTRQVLLDEAIRLTNEESAEYLELRQAETITREDLRVKENKVTCILPLDKDPEAIWNKRFCSNLRNKIRKAEKHELKVSAGDGTRFIKEFYNIFARNMRDLGTPVVSKRLFENIVKEFPGQAKVFVAYYKDKAIGAKFVMYFKDTMYFIWASSLRDHFDMASASLLNWESIRQACLDGYRFCDFGRSTEGDGAFKFKTQYGVEVKRLHWYYYLNGKTELPGLDKENKKYRTVIELWKRLPVSVANRIGPCIVKYIP